MNQFNDDKLERAIAKRRSADKWIRYLRSCPVCSCAFPIPDLMCPNCWSGVDQWINYGKNLRQEYNLYPVYSLFSWTRENDLVLRPLIYALKRGWNLAAVDRLAAIFAAERSLCDRDRENSILVPAPSRQAAFSDHVSIDHAMVFALALSQLQCAPVLNVLQNLPELSGVGAIQKRLSQHDRLKRRYVLVEEMRMTSRRIVFVDDLITSGATAEAAFNALDRPKDFEVWTLFSRPKLATF